MSVNAIWAAIAGNNRAVVNVPVPIEKELRLNKFVPVFQTYAEIDDTKSFESVQSAAVAAAREIFYVSTLDKQRFEKFGLPGDFNKTWGGRREYGIAIYEKSNRFWLTWRRHSGHMAVAADNDLKNGWTYV